MGEHATFGASNSEIWLNCHGSIKMSEGIESEDTSYSSEGTKAHECLAVFLKSKRPFTQKLSLERKGYPQEMIRHALDAYKEVLNRTPEDATVLSEIKVDASSFTRKGEFGTLDVAIIEEFGTLNVIDFKYGAGVVVEVENNSQLVYYALAVSELYHHNFERVKMTIIQPRAFHESGKTIRDWEISIDELLNWGPKFKAAVKRSLEPNAKLLSGDHCRWCKGAFKCPEISNKKLREAQVVFSDEAKFEIEEPKKNPIGRVIDLSKALHAVDKLELWIKAIKQQAHLMLERGEELPGWKLVPKRASRKYKNEDKAAAYAKEYFGDIAFKNELLSPTQIEEQLTDKVNGVDKFLAKHVIKESSGNNLVPEDDPREAIDPLNCFDVVDEEDKLIKIEKRRKKYGKKTKTRH